MLQRHLWFFIWLSLLTSQSVFARVCSEAHLVQVSPRLFGGPGPVGPLVAEPERRASIQSKIPDYLNETLGQSKFVIQRTFPDYLGHLITFKPRGGVSLSLLDSLARLTGDSHIIDLGAGRMNLPCLTLPIQLAKLGCWPLAMVTTN